MTFKKTLAMKMDSQIEVQNGTKVVWLRSKETELEKGC